MLPLSLRLPEGPERRDGHCPPRSYGNEVGVALGDASGSAEVAGVGAADGRVAVADGLGEGE